MVAQVDSMYIRTRPLRLLPRLLSYFLFEGRPLTTKGRWLNPVVFWFAWVLRALPSLRRVEAPVFILGTGRSGTTILGIVLSMHKDVGFLNEPKAIWAGLHPGEDLIGNYNRNPARYRLRADDASAAIRHGAYRVFGGYLRLGCVRRMVEKYPEMIFRTEFIRAIFPDARFLFLSRGGSQTCGSIKDWSQRLGTENGGETHDWWGADDRKWLLLVEQIVPEHPDLMAHREDLAALDHEGRAAVEWIVTMREGIALVEADISGTLHVPYESLCADPRAWAKRLEDFLGLRADKTFQDYAGRVLSNSERDATLALPEWLETIFDQTEERLDVLSQAATTRTTP